MLTTKTELAARRQTIAGSATLTSLSRRLRTLVQSLIDRPLAVPDRKAMLSQDGGVCPNDGSRLEFDPFSPDAHRCPRCHKTVAGERHHLAWLMRYHLWLSERAVHLALLGVLDDDPRLTARANEILTGYAWRYSGFPNRDNVLGPTRLFFSTYLESIWLIQVSIAASITGVDVMGMVAESAGIIRSYDEAWSNRQVWNNAAMIAAGRLLGDSALVSHGLDRAHGLRAQLATAVSTDGFWFEGQNYHFFALRGLQLGAELLRGAGVDLYADPDVGPRLSAMYTAPLQSLLPDLTIPARSDSPYGVSVRQPRFAELWEVARTRTGDERISALLVELYREGGAETEDAGLAEVAEVEQNRPASRLLRERLGWKALLWMAPEAPVATAGWEPASSLSPDYGLAVLRSRGRYASLECGGRPGGHGHPDLLHLTLYWDQPWLMDFGTGSYVSPSLFWYRSTLAHNAPGVAGTGQLARHAWCAAFDQQAGWSWCKAVARDVFGPKSTATRFVLMGPDYVLDVLDIQASSTTDVDLPVHPLGAVMLPPGADREPAQLDAAHSVGHETGYDHVDGAARLVGKATQFEVRGNLSSLFVTLAPRPGETLFIAAAPGPPDLSLAESGSLEFVMRRGNGAGRWIQVWSASPAAVRAIQSVGDEIVVTSGAGGRDVIMLGKHANVRTPSGSVKLGGSLREPSPPDPGRIGPMGVTPLPATIEMGAGEYRRSEEPYDPSRFRATVTASALGRAFDLTVRVAKPELVFRRATDADPRLDNEPPDIHSDGVQCYFGLNDWQGFLLIPDPDSPLVRVRPVAGTGAEPRRISATWKETPDGYVMSILCDLGREARKGDLILFNVIVNQMIPGRQRRAGQLALSGGGGWVYLRGDREPRESVVAAEVQ
ncbi:MAG: hypothetical protein EXR93_01300 [Gemmatimonadetes bacterium]|nr:hypothetical protein [Gemmatimonadota bacterium]